jgi:hypothetical protein
MGKPIRCLLRARLLSLANSGPGLFGLQNRHHIQAKPYSGNLIFHSSPNQTFVLLTHPARKF